MSFQATVINVMIASPSDVPDERQSVRNVLYEWNAIHADERKIVLLPVGWETHSAPGMEGPPQSIINRLVLDGADILVGIFWTRIGTPTTDYSSGAVEEIERHISSKKLAMLYFSEAPIPPSHFNSDQYNQLQKFKDDCKARGLYHGFNSTEEFQRDFDRHLRIRLKEYFAKYQITIDGGSILGKYEPINEFLPDEVNILRSASLDRHGIIHRIRVSGGSYLETNKEHFIKVQSAREIARWDAVLSSLVEKGCIESVGFKGDTFKITAKGFSVADQAGTAV